MRKLFYLAGFFIGIYLMFFFALYSSGNIFPKNTGNLYDCSVENHIESEDLIDAAKRSNVTIFTTQYNNESFFNEDIVFSYLYTCEDSNIEMGYQEMFIPSNKILYKDDGNTGSKIQRFWMIESDDSDIKGLIDDLKDYGISIEIFESKSLSLSVIFSEKNMKFFACIVLLLVFCSSVYYIIRSKEIAILKLNGYKSLAISANVIKVAVQRILVGYTLISICIGIIVSVRCCRFLLDFMKMYACIAVSIGLTMLCVMFIGALYVKSLNIVQALKGNKRNKVIICITVAFKLCVTIILVTLVRAVYYESLDLRVANTSNDNVRSSDFYYITTSKIPDDELMSSLISVIDGIDSDRIFNYGYPTDSLYGHEAIIDQDKRDSMLNDPPIIYMSYNMLDYIPIYSDEGKVIDKECFDNSLPAVLLPDNLSDKTEEVVSHFEDSTNVQVLYTESGQEHSCFLRPSEKVYNAIYYLRPIEKDVYFNNGYVLFHKDIITDVQRGITENEIDSGTVTLVNLSSNYQLTISNIRLRLIDDSLFLAVNLVSFLLAVIAIGIVYCEFRKKEIAVYNIHGVYPQRLICLLCGINILITLSITVCICPLFVYITLIESSVFIVIFNIYRSKKAITALKAE